MLQRAEALFGERDKSYTILGVDFAERDGPSNWFPSGRKDIIIHLTTNAIDDERNALFQLSHEAFHMLSPAGEKQNTIYLEEGLATAFSVGYMEQVGMPIPDYYLGEDDDKYRLAIEYVLELSSLHPDLPAKIKEFRKRNSSISDLSFDQFRKMFPKASLVLARNLTKKFYLL